MAVVSCRGTCRLEVRHRPPMDSATFGFNDIAILGLVASLISIVVGLSALLFAFYAYNKSSEINKGTETALQDIRAKSEEIREWTLRVADRAIDFWTNLPLAGVQSGPAGPDSTVQKPVASSGNGPARPQAGPDERVDDDEGRGRQDEVADLRRRVNLERSRGRSLRANLNESINELENLRKSVAIRNEAEGSDDHSLPEGPSDGEIDRQFLSVWNGPLDGRDQRVFAWLVNNGPASIAAVAIANPIGDGSGVEYEIDALVKRALSVASSTMFNEDLYTVIDSARKAYARLFEVQKLVVKEAAPGLPDQDQLPF